MLFRTRTGEGVGSCSRRAGGCGRLRGDQPSVSIGVEPRTRDGVVACVAILAGDGFDCRSGERLAGLSGRRKGDARGEPKERGEGLYEVAIVEWVEVFS